MEHGDIVEYEGVYYLVLKKNDNNRLCCLEYDFSLNWIPENECRLVGRSDAIFKVMYEIKTCELERR